jgi:hypothetical protein
MRRLGPATCPYRRLKAARPIGLVFGERLNHQVVEATEIEAAPFLAGAIRDCWLIGWVWWVRRQRNQS